jgi:hypothetical protein
VPEGGAVALSLSAPTAPYVGLMDLLVLGGVFRARETEREVPGLRVVRPALPVRVVYANGRLDPEQHTDDVVIALEEEGVEATSLLTVRLGLHGTVEASIGGAGGRP